MDVLPAGGGVPGPGRRARRVQGRPVHTGVHDRIPEGGLRRRNEKPTRAGLPGADVGPAPERLREATPRTVSKERDRPTETGAHHVGLSTVRRTGAEKKINAKMSIHLFIFDPGSCRRDSPMTLPGKLAAEKKNKKCRSTFLFLPRHPAGYECVALRRSHSNLISSIL